jgi:hypothetical protein
MYLMSFMDRVSIGNARLYDMEDELNMSGDDYLLAVSVLFITYCVSQLRMSFGLILMGVALRNTLQCRLEAHAACEMVGWYHFCLGPGSDVFGFLQHQGRFHRMSFAPWRI